MFATVRDSRARPIRWAIKQIGPPEDGKKDGGKTLVSLRDMGKLIESHKCWVAGIREVMDKKPPNMPDKDWEIWMSYRLRELYDAQPTFFEDARVMKPVQRDKKQVWIEVDPKHPPAKRARTTAAGHIQSNRSEVEKTWLERALLYLIDPSDEPSVMALRNEIEKRHGISIDCGKLRKALILSVGAREPLWLFMAELAQLKPSGPTSPPPPPVSNTFSPPFPPPFPPTGTDLPTFGKVDWVSVGRSLSGSLDISESLKNKLRGSGMGSV